MVKFLLSFIFLVVLSGQVFSQKGKTKVQNEDLRKTSKVIESFKGIFNLCDSTSKALFADLKNTASGNIEPPILAIVASNDLLQTKIFHSVALKVSEDTKNRVQSVIFKPKNQYVTALIINSQEGLNSYWSHPENKNVKVFLFKGFEEMKSCKDPLFGALNSEFSYKKTFTAELNKNIFPGQRGPIEFPMTPDFIQN